MKENSKATVHSKFVLGSGTGSTYTDLLIEISLAETPELIIASEIENPDKNLIEHIKEQCLSWIKTFSDSATYLSVKIKSIGYDSERTFDAVRGVNNAFHDALPKIGIKPPQIFSL